MWSGGVQFADERVGEFDTQLVEHTYQSLANNSGMTLHVRKVRRPLKCHFSPEETRLAPRQRALPSPCSHKEREADIEAAVVMDRRVEVLGGDFRCRGLCCESGF
jgi:imidazoleglycerol phosphate dehydratase HisB